jgi:hypothetical protein
MHILFLGNVDTLKRKKENQFPRGDLGHISTGRYYPKSMGLTYVGENWGEVGE